MFVLEKLIFERNIASAVFYKSEMESAFVHSESDTFLKDSQSKIVEVIFFDEQLQ